MSKKNQPIHEALRRRNCQGALWRHEEEEGPPSYRLSVTRSTKDAKSGDWRNETIYLSIEDAPRLSAILDELQAKAYALMQADYEAQKRASA